MRQIKTPMQRLTHRTAGGSSSMNLREAERRGKPRSKPIGEIDPSDRPLLGRDPAPDLDAANEWLAHIQAGRIPVR